MVGREGKQMTGNDDVVVVVVGLGTCSMKQLLAYILVCQNLFIVVLILMSQNEMR